MTQAPVIDSDILAGLLFEVSEEIQRAGQKHGPESMAAPGHDMGKRLGIIAEELGETADEVALLVKMNHLTGQFGQVARATTYDNGSPAALRAELLQLGTMTIAMLHGLEVQGFFSDEA